jgi:hypothetical protein
MIRVPRQYLPSRLHYVAHAVCGLAVVFASALYVPAGFNFINVTMLLVLSFNLSVLSYLIFPERKAEVPVATDPTPELHPEIPPPPHEEG